MNDLTSFSPDEETQYRTGEIPFLQGEQCKRIGLVLSGELRIQSTHPNGNIYVIQTVKTGQFFGDVMLLSEENPQYLGNVLVTKDTTVAFLYPETFLKHLQSSPEILKTYLRNLAEKTFTLTQELKLLGQPSLRDRILFYLYSEAEKQGSRTVNLSLNREEFSQKLRVARPSLSRELSHLQADGLIVCSRHSIQLIK